MLDTPSFGHSWKKRKFYNWLVRRQRPLWCQWRPPLWFWKLWKNILDFGKKISKILKIKKILKILICNFQSRNQLLTLRGVYPLKIFGFGAIYEKDLFFTDFLACTPKKSISLVYPQFWCHRPSQWLFWTVIPQTFQGGGLKVDLVSPVWPPAPSKVSLSEKLSMVFRYFFWTK